MGKIIVSDSQIVEPTGEVSSACESEGEISIDGISRKRRKLKVGKAAGADEIRAEFIKNSVLSGIL